MFAPMRFMASLLTLAFVAACASAPASSVSTATAPPVAATPAHSRASQLLAAAGRPDAPSQADIERALGPADISRRDGAGLALTYRFESCALLLVFTADGRNAMRLAEAHPSARRNGAPAPSLDQCAAEASARRS